MKVYAAGTLKIDSSFKILNQKLLGLFSSLENAKQFLLNQSIYEDNYYNYGLIEEHEVEDLKEVITFSPEQFWFKVTSYNSVEQIKQPKEFKNIVNWWVG